MGPSSAEEWLTLATGFSRGLAEGALLFALATGFGSAAAYWKLY